MREGYTSDYIGVTKVIEYSKDNFVIEHLDQEFVAASIQFELTHIAGGSCFFLEDMFDKRLKRHLAGIYDPTPEDTYDFINDLEYSYFPDGKSIYLSYLYTDDNYKLIGLARDLMTRMIDYCDKHFPNIPIVLLASPYRDFGHDKKYYLDVLIEFYKKFGFKTINKNIEDAYMYKA